MTPQELQNFRAGCGLTEEEMAKRLGLNVLKYVSIENGREKVGRLHVLAIERIGLAMAVDRKDPELAPAAARRAAIRLAMIVLEQNRPAAAPSVEGRS